MLSEATSCFVALTCSSIWPRQSGAFWSFAAQRKPNHITVTHMKQVLPMTTRYKKHWEKASGGINAAEQWSLRCCESECPPEEDFFPTNHTGWVKLSWLKTILIPDQRDFLQLTLSTLFSEDCNQRVLTYEVSYSSLCASIRLRCNIKPCFDAYPPRLAQVNIYFQTPSVCKRKWESHM